METHLQDAAPKTTATTVSLDEERIERISEAIRAEEARLRHRYPILKHQDAIGIGILLFSLSGMIASGYLYIAGVLPAYLSIPLSALFASLSHELEHDLIHRLYFRRNLAIQNLMMLVVWIMRPNTVNPWYRRDIHFLHHKVSGTPQDLEERLVGNGIENLLTRFIVMADGLLGILVRIRVLNAENRRFNFIEILNAGFPFATLYFATWYVFLIYHGALLAFDGAGHVGPGAAGGRCAGHAAACTRPGSRDHVDRQRAGGSADCPQRAALLLPQSGDLLHALLRGREHTDAADTDTAALVPVAGTAVLF